MRTKQECFDHVAIALLKQNATSMAPKTGSCSFRDPYGRRCAVGHLLDDHVLDIVTEKGSYLNFVGICQLLSAEKLKGEECIKELAEYEGMFHELLAIHDGKQVADWFPALYDLATFNTLSTKALDAYKTASI